jgi:hypothetical protein
MVSTIKLNNDHNALSSVVNYDCKSVWSILHDRKTFIVHATDEASSVQLHEQVIFNCVW